MTTQLPTRTEAAPCQGSTLQCLLGGLAIVAVVPLTLWVLSEPVLAALVAASAAIVIVTLVALVRGDGALAQREG